jgi:hypothetical protein
MRERLSSLLLEVSGAMAKYLQIVFRHPNIGSLNYEKPKYVYLWNVLKGVWLSVALSKAKGMPREEGCDFFCTH